MAYDDKFITFFYIGFLPHIFRENYLSSPINGYERINLTLTTLHTFHHWHPFSTSDTFCLNTLGHDFISFNQIISGIVVLSDITVYTDFYVLSSLFKNFLGER